MSSEEPKRLDLAAVPPEGLNALRLLFEAVVRRLAREATEFDKQSGEK